MNKYHLFWIIPLNIFIGMAFYSMLMDSVNHSYIELIQTTLIHCNYYE